MGRPSCRFILDTSSGDLDTRRQVVFAADVEGRALGRVRSQQDLARLEGVYGRLLLGSAPKASASSISQRLRRDGMAGWSYMLAGGDGMSWCGSRQRNVASIAQAARSRAATGDAAGDAVRAPEDTVAFVSSPSGRPLPLLDPDARRFAFPRPPRDPGVGWVSSFDRALSSVSDNGVISKLKLREAGSVIAARAFHLAANELNGPVTEFALRARLTSPSESPVAPARLLERVDAALAVWDVQQGARFDLGLEDGVAELAKLSADAEDLRAAWLSALASSSVQLLRDLRPFGPSGMSPLRSGDGLSPAAEAVESALTLLPSAWVDAFDPFEVEDTDPAAGYAGRLELSRSGLCALVSVRADAQLGDPVSVAAHELGHLAQMTAGLGPRVRAAEEALLASVPVYLGGDDTEVRLVVPGDLYAGVWSRGPAGDLPSELLPQLLSWLAFDPDRSQTRSPASARQEWARRFWPGAPEVFATGLAVLAAT